MTSHVHSSRNSAGVLAGAWHLTDYLRVVYKRRWVAIPGFLVVFLSGTLNSLRTVPIYEAQTQLLIEKDAPKTTTINSVLDDQTNYYDDDFYPTQYKLLQSRALAQRTLETLDKSYRPEQVPQGASFSLNPITLVETGVSKVAGLFASKPERPAAQVVPQAGPTEAMAGRISGFIGSTNVVPVQRSRLVNLTYRSADAEYAQQAVNTLAQQYISQNLELRQKASSQTNKWLNDQLDQAKQAVAAADGKLQDYKVSHDAGSVDDRQNIVVAKLNSVNTQLVAAQLDRISKESQYKQLQDFQRGQGSLESLPAVMNDEVIQSLKGQMTTLQNSLAQNSVFGPEYPANKALQKQIDGVKEQINQEVAKIAGSIKAEFDIAAQKETALQQSLNQQQNAAMGLDRKAMDYAQLDRDAKTSEQLYEGLLKQAKEANASSEYRGTNIQIVDKAEYPQFPVLPNTSRDVTMAALGGLILAVGLAFGFEYLDSRIKSPEEVRAHLGIPFLGLVPLASLRQKDTGESPMLDANVEPGFAEAMRTIRTAVLFSTAEEGARSIAITSTGPHEGKTLVSSSLSIVLAQTGQRTLVIDADMRRPRMHEALGRSQEPGLSNVLVGETTVVDAVRQTQVPNLWLLAAGHIPPNPAELIGSKKYAELMEDLKKRFDWIVIDAPPVMPVTDAALLAHTAGGVIFVIGSEMTPRRVAATAIENLRGANAHFIGAILNRVNVKRHSYYYSAYYRKEYGKYYQRSGSQA